jgi:3-dehydroquinate dehydratase type I
VIGIVTGANRNDPDMWEALAECDIAEFRADLFDPRRIPEEFLSFRADRDRRGLACGTLLTIRLARDGGAWQDAHADRRLEIWEALGCAGREPAADWIDIEIEEYGKLPAAFRNGVEASDIRLLLSHHDFSACPAREALDALLQDMLAHRPDGVKFAVTCADRVEAAGLMAFARAAAAASPNACVLSMGGAGRATRVLGPVLGCPLAYGYLTGRAVAPGQLSAAAIARGLEAFSAALPPGLLEPGEESRLLDWAEARLQGVPID